MPTRKDLYSGKEVATFRRWNAKLHHDLYIRSLASATGSEQGRGFSTPDERELDIMGVSGSKNAKSLLKS